MAQKKTEPNPKKSSASTKQAKKPAKTAAPKKATARAVSLELVDLTPAELKALPHPREGFEEHVAPLLALYAAHPDELGIKAFSLTEVEGRFGALQALKPVEKSAAKHLEMVQETRALHASKVWSAMLDIYAKAQAAARTSDEVRRGVADFTAFMALGPRKKKPAPEK